MSYGHFDHAPRGNFRTVRDIYGEDISIDAQARGLRSEAVGRLASRLRRAIGSVAKAYVRGHNYGQQYGLRSL